MDLNKKPIYPVEPWLIRETDFKTEYNYRNETAFALSNGYIGTRGTFEESYEFDLDTGLEGNFINGFYESEKIRYGEANFGSPEYSQSLLNLPNLKKVSLFLEDELFDMRTGTVKEYSRALDMKAGILKRSLLWTSPKGCMVKLHILRLVSFHSKNLMEIRYEVTPLNFSGTISFHSCLKADVENHTRKTNPIVDYGPYGRKLEPDVLEASKEGIYYQGMTENSRLTIACGCTHEISCSQANALPVSVTPQAGKLEADLTFKIQAGEGQTIALDKFIVYSSSLDMPKVQLSAFVREQLKEARNRGFKQEAAFQEAHMDQFWETADVKVQEDEALLQGIRFNLFHIMQAAGRDGKTGMGAKGLTGEGYEGHYFWDTEIYMLPVFIYTKPDLAKKLLDYRYHTLNEARDRARILGHKQGALFPWRTINGQEASTYYPLGTAQYHINGDISYALCLYMDVTGDVDYLKEKGAEILIETARVWADVGSFAECKDGKYCICSVTGPDEYNVLVDNNFYTNLMARENLKSALKAVEYMKEHAATEWEALKSRVGFHDEETKSWKKIEENMYFPYDKKRDIYPLDDGFMMRKPWDESKIPQEKRAWLYENYHPLFIMRHRMSKQADSILAMYLYSNLFTEEEIRRNYDFYQEVTLHHSSLSTCIFGIVASQIGYHEEAYEYFSRSARMDLDDYHNNVYAGIHGANMAGTWQAIVNGFAGLRTHDSKLSFNPWLPEKWKGYTFCITYRKRLLKVEITPGKAVYTLLKGTNLTFYSGTTAIYLEQEGDSYCETI